MLHRVEGTTSFCWALIAVFLHMQFGPIDSTVILIEKGGTGLSRGCAFVNFSTYEAAMASIAALDNQVILPGGPYNLRVSPTCKLLIYGDYASDAFWLVYGLTSVP